MPEADLVIGRIAPQNTVMMRIWDYNNKVFIEAEVGLADFANAITGLSTKCKYEIRGEE